MELISQLNYQNIRLIQTQLQKLEQKGFEKIEIFGTHLALDQRPTGRDQFYRRVAQPVQAAIRYCKVLAKAAKNVRRGTVEELRELIVGLRYGLNTAMAELALASLEEQLIMEAEYGEKMYPVERQKKLEDEINRILVFFVEIKYFSKRISHSTKFLSYPTVSLAIQNLLPYSKYLIRNEIFKTLLRRMGIRNFMHHMENGEI